MDKNKELIGICVCVCVKAPSKCLFFSALLWEGNHTGNLSYEIGVELPKWVTEQEGGGGDKDQEELWNTVPWF